MKINDQCDLEGKLDASSCALICAAGVVFPSSGGSIKVEEEGWIGNIEESLNVGVFGTGWSDAKSWCCDGQVTWECRVGYGSVGYLK